MSMLQAFADQLKVTFPLDRWDDFSSFLPDFLGASGFHVDFEGTWRHPISGGTVKLARKYGVGTLGVSGSSLASLRASGGFPELLSFIGEGPHRVTGLHIAYDVPEAAPPRLRRAYRRGLAGKVALTQKPIPPSQVQKLFGAGILGGDETGTVYLGSQLRDAYLAVYDKRQELLKQAIREHGDHASVLAANDPGPLTRYELRVGRHLGATLRDVWSPSSLFWHLMRGAGLLSRPAGVPAWTSQALGFTISRSEPDLMRQLDFLLETSPDIHRMLHLSDRISREGRAYLLGRLRRLVVSRSGPGLVVSAAAASS